MAENYTDEDYHRLHRAHCHTAERLAAAESERDEAVQLLAQSQLALGLALRQRDEALAENARLLAALAPFAKAAGEWDPEQNDGHAFGDLEEVAPGEGGLFVGDLRRARNVAPALGSSA